MKATSDSSRDASGDAKRSAKQQTRRMIALAFDKLAQLVLQNRVAINRGTAGATEEIKVASWFNLQVREVDWIAALTSAWKKDHSKPMNVIVYHGKDGSAEPRVALEHWQCSFLSKQTAAVPPNLNVIYAKFIMLFRSVYLFLKILPAYKAFQATKAFGAAGGSGAPALSYQVSAVIAQPSLFGQTKPEKIEFARIDTAFGTLELNLWYRKDVMFALAERPEIIPTDSIIPDYAPSLSAKNPSRFAPTKPMSIQGLSRQSSLGTVMNNNNNINPMTGRQRAHTDHAMVRRQTEAHSQPLLEHTRLSFSPPGVASHSVYPQPPGLGSGDPAFPFFEGPSPRKISPRGASGLSSTGISGSPRSFREASTPRSKSYSAHSQSPLVDSVVEEILSRVSGGLANSEADRILTAVASPSFSMYERALHESPDPGEADGPVFAIEGSFADDEENVVQTFVRHCQSKPSLKLIEYEQQALSAPNSDYGLFCAQTTSERRRVMKM